MLPEILARFLRPIRWVVKEEPMQYPPPCRYTIFVLGWDCFFGIKLTPGTPPNVERLIFTPNEGVNFENNQVCGCKNQRITLGERGTNLDSDLLIRRGIEIRRLRRLNDSPRPMFTQALQETTCGDTPLNDGYGCLTPIRC